MLIEPDLIGVVCRLQMARAQRLEGNIPAARQFYKEFLSLWKNADSDLPIYRQAKMEYAALPADSILRDNQRSIFKQPTRIFQRDVGNRDPQSSWLSRTSLGSDMYQMTA